MLLCDTGYYGTLAAVRSLGRAGVPVTTVDPSILSPARWSRHVKRHVRCPSFEETRDWADWLLRFGATSPKHALYATSDDVSFVLALHQEALESLFALYQPDIDTMMNILDKGLLLGHARAVGLDSPDTWLPKTAADIERIARDADGAVLVKPRTQVSLKYHSKGVVAAAGAKALKSAYQQFVRTYAYSAEVARLFPEATQPMIQRFHPEAMHGIYSLSGFRDRSGKHFVTLAANKVLQRPRRLGIGLCFESAPVDADLAAKVLSLCERLGYYGVFELEFIRCGARSLLIDMNARLYNQLALDVARGLDLPRLVYAGAVGDEAEIRRLVDALPTHSEDAAFCNRLALTVMIGAQRLLGTMSREDAAQWREWCTGHGERLVDPVRDDDDPRPFACELVKQIYGYVCHPRAFVKQVALAR
jgi:predicted ATP-grasp superfamily ATP-dependent carboligase